MLIDIYSLLQERFMNLINFARCLDNEYFGIQSLSCRLRNIYLTHLMCFLYRQNFMKFIYDIEVVKVRINAL